MVSDVPSIVAVALTADAIEVRFDSRADPVRYPWTWVRDHSEDPSSLDPATGQRLVDTFAIPADAVATGVALARGTVRVDWLDGSPPSELSAALLAEVAGLLAEPPKAHWGAGSIPDLLPAVDHDAVLDSDDAVLVWLDAVERLGVGLVRGMPTTADAARTLAGRVAAPRSTIFGDMWRVSPEVADHADSAYARTHLEPHTDGAYSHDAPGLQMFACLERAGAGGESILVDGFSAAERLRVEAPERFDMLAGVAVPGRYHEPGVRLRAERPTIGLDPRGVVRQVTFNNYDRAPFLLPSDEMACWY